MNSRTAFENSLPDTTVRLGDLPEGAPKDTVELAHARLRHLFRHALRSGSVNPLMHLVPRYRSEVAP